MAKLKLHPKLAKWKSSIEKRANLKDIIVNPSYQVEYVNSGSTVLNMLIGGSRLSDGAFVCPGWPRGSISEIIGRESSGKTTIALTAMGQALAANGGTGCGLYVDLECAVKDHYSAKLGVDFRPPELGGPGNALRASPHTFEETEAIVTAAAINGVDLIVVDSVAGMVSEREVKRDPVNAKEKQMIAEIPRAMSNWLPKLQQIIARSGSCVIFTNQTRDKIGVKGFAEETLKSTPGGNALKFWAGVRVWLKPRMSTKAKLWNPILKQNEDLQIATDIECKMVKNKIDAKQGHSGLITIRYGVGIDELRTMMNVAQAYEIVKTVGKKNKDGETSEKTTKYSFQPPGEKKPIEATGVEKFRLALTKDKEALQEFHRLCTERILQGFREIDDEELARLADGAEFRSMDDENEEYLDAGPPDTEDADSEDAENAAAMLEEAGQVATVTVEV